MRNVIRLRKKLAKEALAEKEREIRAEKKRLVEQRNKLVSRAASNWIH